jgi:hypothetical protein
VRSACHPNGGRGGCPPWPVLHCNDLSQSAVFFAPANPTTRFARRPWPSVRRTGASGPTRHSTSRVLARRVHRRSLAPCNRSKLHFSSLRHFHAGISFSAGPVSNVPAPLRTGPPKVQAPGTLPFRCSSISAPARALEANRGGPRGAAWPQTKSASLLRRGTCLSSCTAFRRCTPPENLSISSAAATNVRGRLRTPPRGGLHLQAGPIPGVEPSFAGRWFSTSTLTALRSVSTYEQQISQISLTTGLTRRPQ